jgi:transposase
MHIEISPALRELYTLWQNSTEVPAAYALRAKAIMYVADGFNITETSKKTGLSRRVIYKWIHRYVSGDPEWYEDKSRRPHRIKNRIPANTKQRVISTAVLLASLGQHPTGRIVRNKLQESRMHIPTLSTIYKIIGDARSIGIVPRVNSSIKISTDEEQMLKRLARRITSSGIEARRATAVILHADGMPISDIAIKTNTSTTVAKRWIDRFKRDRLNGVYIKKANRYKKAEDESIRQKVFSLLHAPPSSHGINRTSWRLIDLKLCLEKNGIIVSEGVISKIIKSAGYKWKKARKVLTSPDPNYREKLNQIKEILGSLRKDQCFFSIDEFGPCAIRKREGRRIVAPGEEHWVPQYQRSKGSIIITAALELSTNQVTYFYSRSKNTNEMVKLLEMLLLEYGDMETLYLSWDAASWHNSKKLNARIEEANEQAAIGANPHVKVIPLPSSAQFLNVIESIFSGLAKAVIHNSDYGSVAAAKKAIDQYFNQRNEYYRKHPQRAGKKIWGDEIVIPKFSESHNCKNPRW